jgi:hypothetical protein
VDLQRPERRLQRERRRFGLEDEKSPRRVEWVKCAWGLLDSVSQWPAPRAASPTAQLVYFATGPQNHWVFFKLAKCPCIATGIRH